MSHIKLKNALHRLLIAQVGSVLPAGTVIDAELKNARITVRFQCPGFDVVKPGKITLSDHGYMLTVSLFGSATDHTDEAEAVKTKVQELCAGFLASQGATGKVYVTYRSEWYGAQARRMRAAQGAPAAPTAPATEQPSAA